MAKQRVVNTRFWDDDYVTELDPFEKLLFLYFLTNPLTDLCGAYEVSLKRIAFDTGLKPSKITEILESFEAGGKILYRKGWVFIRNFGKHQQGNSPNVRKGAERSLNACPDWVKQTLSKGFGTIGIENALLPEPVGQPKPELLETPQAASTRGTRIPDTFMLTSEMRTYASEKRPDVDCPLETEKFVNHWRAATGRNATKLDWNATWRNWILNARGTNGTNRHFQDSPHKPTSVSRLADTANITDQYPTETELGSIA
jgi:hypothetical protein